VPPRGWIYLKASQSDLLQPLPGGSLAAETVRSGSDRATSVNSSAGIDKRQRLFVGLPAAQEWMFVRNVVTVDRQAVSDSGDRLDRLFKDGGGDRAAYRRFDASVRVLAPDEQR